MLDTKYTITACQTKVKFKVSVWLLAIGKTIGNCYFYLVFWWEFRKYSVLTTECLHITWKPYAACDSSPLPAQDLQTRDKHCTCACIPCVLCAFAYMLIKGLMERDNRLTLFCTILWFGATSRIISYFQCKIWRHILAQQPWFPTKATKFCALVIEIPILGYFRVWGYF